MLPHCLHPDREPECRAAARLAETTDFAAHHFNQTLGDREPQSGPAVSPGRRAVGLNEGLEQHPRGRRAQPDAGVRDFEAGDDVCGIGGQARGAELDRSAIGELDGVREQIVEDLAQPDGIAVHLGWQRRIDLHDESDLLGARLLAVHARDLVDRVAQRKIGRREPETSGLHLRVVEDVVDHREQRGALRLHDLGELALPPLEAGLHQHAIDAEDAAERRANLVADPCEEAAPGVVSLGQLAGALRQFGGPLGHSRFKIAAQRDQLSPCRRPAQPQRHRERECRDEDRRQDEHGVIKARIRMCGRLTPPAVCASSDRRSRASADCRIRRRTRVVRLAPMSFTRMASFSRALACAGLLLAFPSAALAQAPPVDPFLGVSILTTGAAAPGGAVTLDNAIDKIVAGGVGQNQPGLALTNLVGGYDDSVLDPIRNFSAAPFTFTATGVKNANGTAAALGGTATGRRIDLNGNTVAGGGGTFTVNANGTFTFVPGTDFADLVYAPGTKFEDLVAAGAATRVVVDFTLHGVNTATGAARDFSGQLVVALTRQADNSLAQLPGSDFADYGSSSRPTTDHTIFPDLQGFVSGLLRYTFAGQPGSAIVLTNNANVTTLGTLAAYGISATTVGQRGYDGRDASITHSSTDGEVGGVGGPVTVESHGTVRTSGAGAVGIFAWSAGGDGGQGGDSGYTRNAKAGGPAGTGGTILVTGSGEIHTSGDDASGILALSQGGNGGGGGDGSTFNGAENGANGGRGGSVEVNGTWDITTGGAKAYGIWGKSFGGTAGSGGDGGWTGTSAGGGGQGTEGGAVKIVNGGKIQTSGADAYGIFGQSIGGFGGDGGSGTSIFYASGGSGEKAGSGGSVEVTNNGTIITTGERAHGIFAESVGGGGGQGGSGGALVGLGGSGAGGGNAGDVRVVNNNEISATGADARGIYAQSVGGGGGDGGSGSGFVGVGGQGQRRPVTAASSRWPTPEKSRRRPARSSRRASAAAAATAVRAPA